MEGDLRGPGSEPFLADASWLRRIAVSLVGDGAAADDLVQETWIAAVKRTRDEGQPPRAWLAAVLRNFGRQRARSEASRRRREEQTSVDEPLPSPDELVARMEQHRLVAAAVTRLAEPYRSTVILRYTDDLEPSEIARRQGLPPGTVRRRLKVGLDQLREDLDRNHGGREHWVGGLLPVLGLRPGEVAAATGTAATVVGGILVMKKLVLVLAALVAAAGVWMFATAGPERTSGNGSMAALPISISFPAAEDGADAALARVESTPERRDREALAPVATGAASDETVEIVGRVRLAEACAKDPTLEVFALGRATPYHRFARSMDRSRHQERTFTLPGGVLGRAPIDAEGAFELAVPATSDFVHLIVRGRFLYMSESRTVEPGAGEPVELAPTRGAWITGRTVPPAADAGADRSGDGIYIGALGALDPSAGILDDLFQLSVETASDGRFEFRAVPADAEYQLIAAPNRWAALRRDVPVLAPCGRTELTLQLEPGAPIRGTVVDGSGAGVGDAWVAGYLPGKWFGFDDAHVRRTVTRPDGTFELEALPAGTLLVRAGAPDRLESEKRRVELGETAHEGLVLELEEGNAITGDVHWSDGSAAAGVEVSAEFDRSYLATEVTFNALRGATGSTTTDADGRFRLAGVGAGPFAVRATGARGDVRYEGRVDHVQPADRLSIELHAPIALAGRVVDATGRALPRFRVHAARVVQSAVGEMGLDRRSEAFRSDHGTFILADLAEGLWEVSVVGSGHVSALPVRLRVPTIESLEIETIASASVSGAVYTSTGAPAEGAQVQPDPDAPSWLARLSIGDVGPVTRVDEHGRFRLDGLVPGTLALVAASTEHGRSESTVLELAPGALVPGVEFRLTDGGALTGEVLTDQDAPAAGHVVNVEHLTTGDASLMVTDAEGRFSFEHLEPGSWQVMALDSHVAHATRSGEIDFAEIFEGFRVTIAEVVAGERTHVVLRARATEPVTLSGTVRTSTGPHASARILFMPANPDRTASMNTATTDAAGRYEIVVDGPGEYTASVQHTPGPGQDTVEFVRAVPPVAQYTLDFELPSGSIGGRVLAPDGSPAAGARVTIYSDGRTHAAEYHQGTYYEGQTAGDGRYEFTGLRSGTYIVMAGGTSVSATATAAPAYARVLREDIALGEGERVVDVDFDLPQHGAVKVRVLDTELEPLGGMTVFARDASGTVVDPVSSAATDAAGWCTLDGLAPGAYTLLAQGKRRVTAVGQDVTVTAGEEARAELTVVPGTMLRVALRDATGLPVRGWVKVTTADGSEMGGMIAMVEIYELYYDGVFSPTDPAVGPLPPGRYQVEVTAFPGRTGHASVSVEGERERGVTVRVE
jgi:RNA polymerase sigma-70 factor (ECF subfamily)